MSTAVGIRELRDRLSHYLELVKAGEAITVTDHGREIATITPSGEDPAIQRLREMAARGEIIWSGKRPYIPKRMIRVKGKPLSETIIEDRG